MVCVKLIALLVAFCGCLDATAIPPHHEVHEKRETLHPRWTKQKRVEPRKLLPMRIGLAQSNLDKGYEHLMDV
jgi:tripeptidyl-peptidase-1